MINVKMKEQVCVERKEKREKVKKMRMWIGEEEKEREMNVERKNRKNK